MIGYFVFGLDILSAVIGIAAVFYIMRARLGGVIGSALQLVTIGLLLLSFTRIAENTWPMELLYHLLNFVGLLFLLIGSLKLATGLKANGG